MDSTSFTFLATVLVLILLSASLVLRSYILRRRYRQRFQQALADGLFVDFDRSAFNDVGPFDPFGGFRRQNRRLGPKPVLWDTRILPADKDDAWSSTMPVAVYRTSLLSPSTLISSPQPSAAPGSPTSLPAQSHRSLFSQLHLPSPFSRSPPLPSPPPRRSRTPIGSPTGVSTRSPSAQPGFPNLSTHAKINTSTLAVCVLVAMPDVSTRANRAVPDVKGKGVDPLESQAHQVNGGDVDPLLPSHPPRSGPRIVPVSNYVAVDNDEESLPLLEFGVVEVRTAGEWASGRS